MRNFMVQPSTFKNAQKLWLIRCLQIHALPVGHIFTIIQDKTSHSIYPIYLWLISAYFVLASDIKHHIYWKLIDYASRTAAFFIMINSIKTSVMILLWIEKCAEFFFVFPLLFSLVLTLVEKKKKSNDESRGGLL